MIVIEYIVATGLFLIFLVTIIKELKFFDYSWSQFPFLFHFIPSWSFFAPNPYHSDYFILVRFIEKEKVKEWKQVYKINEMRKSYSIFWNPQKWLLKSIADVSIDLLKIASFTKEKTSICLSLPYLSILNWIQILKSPSAEKIQFAIMCRAKEGPEVLFLSETHPLNNE